MLRTLRLANANLTAPCCADDLVHPATSAATMALAGSDIAARWLSVATPPTHDLLDSVFRLAHSTWSRNFLFFPNPTDDAGILASPRHLQHKVAGNIRLDMRAERIGPYRSEPYLEITDRASTVDEFMYADWVLVPAFTFEQQTASYFMHMQSIGPVQDNNGASRSALYRIIADDVTGETLYIGDMPETDTYQVIHMRHVTGALRERIVCFFEGSVFRQALDANDGALSLSHLVKAMTMSIHTRETRKCFTCGAPPGAGCSCRVLLRHAEYPSDMRFLGYNAGTHLGSFRGKQSLMYMHDGKCMFQRKQITRHRTNVDMNREVANRLREWAVQDRLANARPRCAIPSDNSCGLALTMIDAEHKSFDELIDDLAELDKQESTSDTPNIPSDNAVDPKYEHTVIHSMQAAPGQIYGTFYEQNKRNSTLPATATGCVLLPSHQYSPAPSDQLTQSLQIGRQSAFQAQQVTRQQIITPNELSSPSVQFATESCPAHQLLVQQRVAQQNISSHILQKRQHMLHSDLNADRLLESDRQIHQASPRGVTQQQLSSQHLQIPSPLNRAPINVIAPVVPDAVSAALNTPVAFSDMLRNSLRGADPMSCGSSADTNGHRNASAPVRRGRVFSQSVSMRAVARERRLLPRGNRPVMPTENMHDRELDLRIRKREAARRSDKRRFKRLQQLREERVKLEQRTGELRKRKAELLDDNLMLKNKVAALRLLKR